MTSKQRIILNYGLFLLGLVLFLLPLIDGWMLYPLKGFSSGQTRYSALGGILPWSDAAGYYHGANTLLDKGFLTEWTLRRPLNAILLAARLFIVNHDFKAALILQALLCGSSCLLVAYSIARRFSSLAAFIAFVILFLFAKIYIPSILSESLGLSIGCLAFVFLWEAVNTRRLWLFFVAGFMLMLGLNARAGAFFVVPMLMVWLGFYCRDRSHEQRFHSPIASLFTLGVLAASFLNMIFMKLSMLAGQVIAPHGNFAPTLFGLVSGGKGWHYAYETLKFSGTEADFSKHMYVQSLAIFKQHPDWLLIGLLKNWAQMFKAPINLFNYLLGSHQCLALVLLAGLSAVVLSKLFRLRILYQSATQAHQHCMMLVTVVMLGMILSAGVIWMDGNARVFAVTTPFFAAAVGMLVCLLTTKKTSLHAHLISENTVQTITWETKFALLWSVILMIASVLTPLFASHFHPRTLPSVHCLPDQKAMIISNIAKGPYLHLKTKDGRFDKKLMQYFNAVESNLLKNLEPGNPAQACLGLIYDRITANTYYIVAPDTLFSNQRTSVGVCMALIPGNQHVYQFKTLEAFNES